MSPKVRRIYNAAKKDEKFIDMFYAADGDKVPNMFSDKAEKVLFATMYYGWLISRHGVKWEDFI